MNFAQLKFRWLVYADQLVRFERSSGILKTYRGQDLMYNPDGSRKLDVDTVR